VPTEPRARARTIWFDEYADTLLGACGGKMFFNRIVAPVFLKREGDLAAADAAECNELPPLLDYLESVIPESGFLVEDRLTLADIAVASPFANFRLLGLKLDPARWPKTLAYADAILARPSYKPWVEKEAAFLAKTAA
ncbi:MAG TPA: glutathione S-transferase family protein, partial [Allosphingosinicella sp.]